MRELRRNPALQTLCEFDPAPLQSPPKKVLERVDGVLRVNFVSQAPRSTIPDSHNFSRFLKLVLKIEQKQGSIAAMIPTLREQLMAVLPDFGQHLGYDGKSIDPLCIRWCRSIKRSSKPSLFNSYKSRIIGDYELLSDCDTAMKKLKTDVHNGMYKQAVRQGDHFDHVGGVTIQVILSWARNENCRTEMYRTSQFLQKSYILKRDRN